MSTFKDIPKKYHPKGFAFLYEDRDLIIGNKSAGALAVRALWNKDDTIHSALNDYVRRGNAKSRKCVYVVHRLDQDTTGVLVYAKTEEAQQFVKNDWKNTKKTYLAVVHGQMKERSATISSYLLEDEDYVVHSTNDGTQGKLSHTAYSVIQETKRFSLLKLDLLTGRKNQIRVHLSEEGHPVVGDSKYAQGIKTFGPLALHAYSITLTHPFNKKRLTVVADIPPHFNQLMGGKIRLDPT